tara:strand:- start:1102 stop:1695 length:594 start_codon:yes stop_codon:yes gene_type:complete
MTQHIDYYLTSISPFTYLGHTTLLQIAKDAGAKIRYKPVKLGQVFAVSGALPLAERPKCRQAYRLLEIGRWAKKRGLPVNLHPAHFPTNPGLADSCVIALQEAGQDAGVFLGQVLAACWSQQKNIADEAVIREILTALDIDADALVNQAQSQQIQTLYEANSAEAIDRGVLGSPAYLLNGEQFWGQDRLELLAEALK